jgi:hypothetical protein
MTVRAARNPVFDRVRRVMFAPGLEQNVGKGSNCGGYARSASGR